MKKTYFIVGWFTTLFGAVLLVLELFSLIFIRNKAIELESQTAMGSGFLSSAIEYAKVAPMPIILGITALIMIAGIALIIYSFTHVQKEK